MTGCLRPLVLRWFAGRSVAHCPAQPLGVRTDVSAVPVFCVWEACRNGWACPNPGLCSFHHLWHGTAQPGGDGGDHIVSAHCLGQGTRDGVEAVCVPGSSAGATEIFASREAGGRDLGDVSSVGLGGTVSSAAEALVQQQQGGRARH